MRYIQKHKQFVPRKRPDIVGGTITFGNGATCELVDNDFSVKPGFEPYTLYIYHMYDYHTENGEHKFGRWYKTTIPLQHVLGLPADNTFETVLEHYEHGDTFENIGPVVIRVTFTEKAAAKLRTVPQQTPPPIHT